VKRHKTQRTKWHEILGLALERLLVGVKIRVFSSFKISNSPPEVDLLLIQSEENQGWSKEQLERLPDGIRQSTASHHLIEFKYTESFNGRALRQALGYEYFYSSAQEISESEIQTYVLSSKTPQAEVLKARGYEPTKIPGVYETPIPDLGRVRLIVANELEDKPYNAVFKCFASREGEQDKGFETVKKLVKMMQLSDLEEVVTGLHFLRKMKGEEKMMMKITQEDIIEAGKIFGDTHLALMSPEDLKKKLSESQKQGLVMEGRLEGLKEGRMETAKNLLSFGMEPSKIAQATGLSLGEVRKLKKS
jgi:hypothetical protein